MRSVVGLMFAAVLVLLAMVDRLADLALPPWMIVLWIVAIPAACWFVGSLVATGTADQD